MNSANLPPIDIKEDIKKYEAHSETTELSFKGCTHKQAQYNREKGEIRCICGSAWSGERLHELAKALKLDKSK